MPKLIITLDYKKQNYLFDYLDEHVEVIQNALEQELSENYTPPVEMPEITVEKEK